ncbi:MAG: hypothetical protein GY755_08450 [Chloroflexi bacterium]|nr:hypothetical protein [Chloroflexota bacterium]
MAENPKDFHPFRNRARVCAVPGNPAVRIRMNRAPDNHDEFPRFRPNIFFGGQVCGTSNLHFGTEQYHKFWEFSLKRRVFSDINYTGGAGGAVGPPGSPGGEKAGYFFIFFVFGGISMGNGITLEKAAT